MGKIVHLQKIKLTDDLSTFRATLALILLCLFLLTPANKSACAGQATGCATDTWSAMVNQAILQTRREVVMNQRYIAKGDSVLAYSCFEEMSAGIGARLGVFSGTQRWENAEIDILGDIAMVNVYRGAGSMDAAIQSAVMEPLVTYLDTNFNHSWLGGLAGGGAASQSGQPCGTMRNVWQMAKCMNITDDPLFYRFQDLVSTDPRVYPATMICNNTGITTAQIETARGAQTEFAEIVPHLEMVDPAFGCLPPIVTGVTVVRRVGADRITEEVTYVDGLCMTPGCSYQNAGNSGLGTCQIK